MEHTFKEGDRVRIRSRGSMCRELGRDCNGEPHVRMRWCPAMDHMCGRTAVVKTISEGGHVTLGGWSDTSGDLGWSISTDMLEPVTPHKETAAQKRARLEKEKLTKRLAAIEAKEKAAQEKAERAAKEKSDKARIRGRNKALAKLPRAAQRALLYLDDQREAFGCQREHVIGIVAALTGVSCERLKEASRLYQVGDA